MKMMNILICSQIAKEQQVIYMETCLTYHVMALVCANILLWKADIASFKSVLRNHVKIVLFTLNLILSMNVPEVLPV
jgi:cytidylate kinase